MYTISIFLFTGYAVGAGHFLTPTSIEVVGGAPQQEQTGKVRAIFYWVLCILLYVILLI